MTARMEEVLKRLSPQQVDALLERAEAMAQTPRPRGRRLRLDWTGSVDSEFTNGVDAQRQAMADWTNAIQRSLAE